MKNEYRPRVRFMKFRDEWKLLSMKNFINNMYGGASITPSDYQKDGVPTVPKSAINSSGIANLSNSKFVSDDYCQKNLNSSVYSGDFVTSLRDLVPTAPNMGRVVKLIGESKRYLMPQGVYRLLLEKNVDENFLIAFSNSDKFRNSILKIKTGSTQVHIRNSQYLGIEIIAPSHEEQKRIGELFEGLNKTIIIHKQELEALKQTKQGFLQKMFPREAEVIPAIRFNDFEENWETKKISEIATETFGGGTPKTAEKRFWSGNIPWIQSSDITQHRVYEVFPKKTISEEAVKSSATKLISKDSIAVVTRVGVGKLALIEYDYSTSQDFVSLSNLKSDKWFTVYSLYRILQRELHNVQGTSIKGITKSELLEKNILLPPNNEEQVKIGEFFRQLDEVIGLKEKEIEALKETKKGFLQKMFV